MLHLLRCAAHGTDGMDVTDVADGEHVVRIGKVASRSTRLPRPEDLEAVDASPVRCLDDVVADRMRTSPFRGRGPVYARGAVLSCARASPFKSGPARPGRERRTVTPDDDALPPSRPGVLL